jgi:hypothetical protein
MQALFAALAPSGAAILAQLDIDGFVMSQQFLSALAQFFSGIVLQLLSFFLFGGSATL